MTREGRHNLYLFLVLLAFSTVVLLAPVPADRKAVFWPLFGVGVGHVLGRACSLRSRQP
jgi:hypothetical protein